MTDVERSSTAPSGQRRRPSLGAAVVAGVVVTVLFSVVLPSARPATGATLASAKAEAAAINSELQADAQKVDALSQAYDTAQQNVAQLNASLALTKAAIGQDTAKVAHDKKRLQSDAVTAYVTGSGDDDFDAMFDGTNENAVVSGEYRSVATSNITNAVDALNVAQARLTAEQSRLQATQVQATAALNQVDTSRQQAEATVAAQQATLSQVTGEIATLLAQQQAEEAAAQAAAFRKRVAQAAAVATAPGHSPGAAPLPPLPAAGGAATAVLAAESQLGVPYHWGGETPGVGFDCSGLTQWAWGRAGVGIPRTAQEQYDAIEHVSLADLEPGDLLFWGGGPGDISHVGLYVGNGDVIHAPETGETVRIQPIWNTDLVGAGRP